MNYTLKLAIPLALGAAAAVVNMMVLKARTNPVTFIQAARDIPLGEQFTLDDLKELPLPGTQAALLKDTAIPYESLGVLVGQAALRDFMEGDIIFFRDFELRGETLQLRQGEVAQRLALSGLDVPPSILRIGYELDFLIQLGPEEPPQWIRSLRLVSVGDRVSNSMEGGSGGVANVIMVAVKRNPESPEDLQRQKLLEEFALKQQQDLARLLNVQISTDKKPTAEKKVANK